MLASGLLAEFFTSGLRADSMVALLSFFFDESCVWYGVLFVDAYVFLALRSTLLYSLLLPFRLSRFIWALCVSGNVELANSLISLTAVEFSPSC